VKDFRRLKVWEKAHILALNVYCASSSFPKVETFGLTSQIRRAGLSIPTNIAEGCGRNADRELSRFLVIAMGSSSELEYLLQFASDMGFLPECEYCKLKKEVIEVNQMLSVFIRKLTSGNDLLSGNKADR
jgi:four helix bundle protein